MDGIFHEHVAHCERRSEAVEELVRWLTDEIVILGWIGNSSDIPIALRCWWTAILDLSHGRPEDDAPHALDPLTTYAEVRQQAYCDV